MKPSSAHQFSSLVTPSHPPKGIVINETVNKEGYRKIKYISRQLAQSNRAHRNIRKSVTVHFDSPEELTKFMHFMVNLDLKKD